jgi:hypothetical protein
VPGFARRCGPDCAWGDCLPVTAGRGCDAERECRFGDVVDCATSCGAGTRTCGAGCVLGPCVPPAERCNGADDDCDGDVDEETFGIAGPVRLLPWIGEWVDSIAGVATADGFAFSYCMNDWMWDAPGTPVVLAFTDASGASQGEPIRLDDPAAASCGALDMVVAGDVVAARGSWPSPTATAFGCARRSPNRQARSTCLASPGRATRSSSCKGARWPSSTRTAR